MPVGSRPVESVFGKIVLSRYLGDKTWRGRHIAKRNFDARQAYPEITGGRYTEKLRFIESQGGGWAQETCAGCTKQRYKKRGVTMLLNVVLTPGKTQGRDQDQDQDQDSLLVKRRNDNHSPGPVTCD